MVKFELEKVKKIFTDKKCFLLESTYVNIKTKMEYICKCGDIYSTSLANFKRRRVNFNCKVIHKREMVKEPKYKKCKICLQDFYSPYKRKCQDCTDFEKNIFYYTVFR